MNEWISTLTPEVETSLMEAKAITQFLYFTNNAFAECKTSVDGETYHGMSCVFALLRDRLDAVSESYKPSPKEGAA